MFKAQGATREWFKVFDALHAALLWSRHRTYLEPVHDTLPEADVLIAPCTWVALRIAVIDTINLRGLEVHLSTNLSSTQSGGGVCCEERLACAGPKNDYTAPF
jgi:hypothetical protein